MILTFDPNRPVREHRELPPVRPEDDEMLRLWKKLVALYQKRPRTIPMLERIADQLLALPPERRPEKGGA